MELKHTWIIDDDAIFTFTVKKILEHNKLANNIEVFTNGQAAKIQLDKNIENNIKLPDVILLDINMPILDGWQFMNYFSRLKERKEIMVYLISSSIDPRDKEKAKLYKDIRAFVVKPVTLKALTELMSNSKSPV